MNVFLVMFLTSMSTLSWAECGTLGSLEERIASCSTNLKNMDLVMDHQNKKFWFNRLTKSIYHIIHSSSRVEAQKKCEVLSEAINFPNLNSAWGLTPRRHVVPALIDVFPELKEEVEVYKLFWLKDIIYNDGSSGEMWVSVFANSGDVTTISTLANEWSTVGGICSLNTQSSESFKVTKDTKVADLPLSSISLSGTPYSSVPAYHRHVLQNGKYQTIDLTKPSCWMSVDFTLGFFDEGDRYTHLQLPKKLNDDSKFPGDYWSLGFTDGFRGGAVKVQCNNPNGPLTIGMIQNALGDIAVLGIND